MSQKDNTYANTLPSLVATFALPPKIEQKISIDGQSSYHPKQVQEINNDNKPGPRSKMVCETSSSLEPKDWRFPFIDFLLYGILSENPKEAKRRASCSSTTRLLNNCMEDRMMHGVLLRCLFYKEAQIALREAHNGMCNSH